jgi:uncharacterized membrane protein YphA (DoxX/SURF4 family)
MNTECCRQNACCGEQSVDLNRRWTVMRFAVALILLIAAILKAATTPTFGEGLLHARWFNILVVEFELFFGIWLLFGMLPRLTWLVTTGIFATFSLVTLSEAVRGSESCHCFGDFSPPPGITMVLDIAIVLALLKTRPKFVNRQFNITSVLIVIGVWFMIGIPFGSMMLGYTAQVIDENGIVSGKGSEIILEPEKWVGKNFPLMNYLEISELPKQGVWLVLLYHHNCSSCRESVKQYSRLAVEFAQKENCPKIAMLEVPPFETENAENKDSPAVFGKLDGKRKWKVKTPVLVLIDNGQVQNVFTNPLDINFIRSIWGGEKQ